MLLRLPSIYFESRDQADDSLRQEDGQEYSGDVGEGGAVAACDSALTAQVGVGSVTVTNDRQRAAEVSGDCSVTAYDAALIVQRAVGIISKFPVEP